MPDPSKKAYQQLQEELDEVLLKLQSSELDADETVKLYESGLVLLRQLESKLAAAETTVKKLKIDFEKG